jgi:hypothetical protein
MQAGALPPALFVEGSMERMRHILKHIFMLIIKILVIAGAIGYIALGWYVAMHWHG